MTEEDLESLENLPSFSEAIKLPATVYYKYARAMFEYRANCQLAIVQSTDKLYEWCAALNCLQIIENCQIPIHPEMTTARFTPSKFPATTMSYIDMINRVGHNGTCYDDYYCTQQSLAGCLHYLLGITCLFFCLCGILSNLLFLPAFNVVSNRNGSTLYLTAMTLFDCFYMCLFTVIVVIRYIPYEFIQQLEMYARFSAYLIPHGLPTMELMELLSVWITVALLVDRFLYLKFGFHAKVICSRKLSVKIVATIVVLLTAYTIPKYLEYQLVSYPKIGITKVMYTTVGFSESFQNLLLHWLKVPVEMFLPYLAVAIFSILNSIKLRDLLVKRKLSQASKERKQRDDNDSYMENALQLCHDNEDYEKAQKYPSLAVDSKYPMVTTGLKSLEDKENAVVVVTLILGFSLIALKLPKFVLHALKSERYVEPNWSKYFQPVTDFLDLMWVVFKPVMFSVANHYKMAVVSVFCCRDYDGNTFIKVLPTVEMNNIAAEYVAQLHGASEERVAEESALIETTLDEMNMDANDGPLKFKSDDLLTKNDTEMEINA